MDVPEDEKTVSRANLPRARSLLAYLRSSIRTLPDTLQCVNDGFPHLWGKRAENLSVQGWTDLREANPMPQKIAEDFQSRFARWANEDFVRAKTVAN